MSIDAIDEQVRLTENMLGVTFKGDTVKEKEVFIAENREAYRKVVDATLRAVYEVATNQVKLFQLNNFEFVAARTLKEAVKFYKECFSDEDFDIHEVTDLDSFMFTLTVLEETHLNYLEFKNLQEEFYTDKIRNTYQVSARKWLEHQWDGYPCIFNTI